ncbi:HNH endonuclease [Natronomonas sp. F2-12]|uniref:HNH endonuclease n=1 Tax=Natronomonas aquatica TaxID=2841590 RepID=A0A9R1D7R6_9EURY|nr:HNH endonuclease signature motif containing protein [Natronomonas aquatica]MCQ4334240.1 HNH endonuclease [Natronomonas aquatica]
MDRDVVGNAGPNGKTFEARIHKIDSSGNGIVETTGQNDIILGPVEADAVGERIEALKLPGPFARIKRPRGITPSNYIEELQDIVSYDAGFSIDYGDAHATIHQRGLDRHESGYGILEYVPPDENEADGDSELIETTIVSISDAGNGMVPIGDGLMNIGPVRDDVVGSDVSVIEIEDGFGVCKTVSVRAEDYFTDHIKTIDETLVDTEKHFEVGMRVQDREASEPENAVIVNLPPISAKDYIAYHNGQTGVSVADENPQYDQYASVVVVLFEETLSEEYPDYLGEKPIPLQTLSNDNIDHYAFPPGRLEVIGDDPSQAHRDSAPRSSRVDSQAESSTSHKQNESEDESNSRKPEGVLADDDSPHKYQTDSIIDSTAENSDLDTSTDRNETKEDTSNSRSSSDIVEDNKAPHASQDRHDAAKDQELVKDDLNELREKAKEDAIESVTKETTTRTTKSQYSRSTAIREYVMARADGICEGCGDPAPFTSKTGEPYLHAHHIHELSDEGSDTPDTVVGLCPNCHYRIHHGEDGNEFNQELLEQVQRLERDHDQTK